jgi:hypothetical protein
MIIISIDVGYHNMALVKLVCDEDYILKVDEVHVIDITKIPHRRVGRCECVLPHTSEVADMMAHFIQEYGYMLDEADMVLVERQPPTGLTQIETLLLYLYRSKTQLVSPNAMHSHFNIGHYEYDRRKEETVRIAESYLEGFTNLGRVHDASDAVCLALFHTHKHREKARLKKIDRTLPFDKYRYEDRVRGTQWKVGT